MIEMLGVLAIIGVLSVGGIAGYSKAMEKLKINKTIDQISHIIANVQTLYAQQTTFNGLNNATAIQMGVIPDDAIIKDSSGGSYLRFASSASNLSRLFPAGRYTRWDDKAAQLEVNGMSENDCVTLVTQDWGSMLSGRLIGIGIGHISTKMDQYDIFENCNSSSHFDVIFFGFCANKLPISPSVAADICHKAKSNPYGYGFSIKFY